MTDYLIEQNSLFLYYLHHCNGICLNLYLKILQKHPINKKSISTVSFLKIGLIFIGYNIPKFQDICKIAKKKQKIENVKILLLLKLMLDTSYKHI